MLKSSIQNKILETIRDDRPITSIRVVENLDKCPHGFYIINKTYDQDQDADLGESSIFKTSARYLCLSKTEGSPNLVVQGLQILQDKTIPPKGFSIIDRTSDTGQKPWKRKQICYSLGDLKDTRVAITDIIICSKLKKAPIGFTFAGELRGVTICYKMGNVQDSQSNLNTNGGNVPERPPRLQSASSPVYPSLDDNNHDYEILRPGPTRPAPRPPPPLVPQNSTHTLSNQYSGLDGVPFVVNPRFLGGNGNDKIDFPIIKAKTMQQIMKDYDYSFTVERQMS